MSKLNKILVVVIVLIIAVVGGLGYYTYFVYDDNKEDDNKDKIAINEKIKNLYLQIPSFSNRLDANLLATISSKSIFLKNLMFVEGKTSKLVDESIESNIYSKCPKEIGNISIKQEEFYTEYEKLYGEEYDKSYFPVNNDGFTFVDDYICSTYATGVNNSRPILKFKSKAYDESSKIYTINLNLLSKTDEIYNETGEVNKYADSSVLEWPSDLEKGTITIKYKLNNDNSYKIISMNYSTTIHDNEPDYSMDTYNGIYSTYLSDTKEIDKLVVDFPYSKIVTENMNHNQLWKTYTVFNIIKNMKGVNLNSKNTKDTNGVTYPEYTEETEILAKNLGLTVDEISKIDKKLWTGGGSTDYVKYDINNIKTKYGDIYETMFTKSFIISNAYLTGFYASIFYDKNVDKLVWHAGGGTTGCNISGTRSVIKGTKQDDKYIVEFVEGYFTPGMCLSGNEESKTYLLTMEDIIETKITSNSKTSDYDKILKQYQDKLPHYELTFKLVDGNYQFDNIKKI